MKKIDKFWVPDLDKHSYDWTMFEIDIPKHLMDTLLNNGKEIKNIIHAGGNIGIYTLEFAKRCKSVYVFEPSNENFSVLSMNCAGIDNIFLYKAALGEKRSTINMINDEIEHCGTWRVSEEEGDVPVLLIDDFNLKDISIIHLDVEGYELYALRGAEQTIRKYKPLIAFECLQHNNKYGYSENELFNYMDELGYKHFSKYSNEIMFINFEEK
jgi:FkbM family methyltransferase